MLNIDPAGIGARQIADELGISENTVNYHMKQLFKSLDVSTKHQAVLNQIYDSVRPR